MKRTRTICFSLITILIAALISSGFGYAAADSKEKLDELNAQIQKIEKELKEGKTKEKTLNSQISKLDKLITAAEGEIKNLSGKISTTSEKIDQVQGDLEQKKEEINKQNEEMNLRLRAMYKNGDVGIVEILLGSNSITDFMTNLDMAQRIFDNDVEVLETLEDQHKVLDTYRVQLTSLQDELSSQKQAKASQQDELEGSRGDVASLKAGVAKNNKVLEAQVDALNEEANALVAEILKLQGGGDYIGGEMAWPAPASTRITSPFGYRIHPVLGIKKLHTGIDIGVGSGKSVVAANAGKVIKAAWNNSYGYMIMIDHGGGIVTLYA
ncbi:MAG: peptidoglycan DD-metalloendopeptidase family protein, partial [Eubacteriales bacterium]|nr:peptidoglycan DD-metalloendopeptidase family protein [Eubacteriales bacterium]